MYVYRMLMFASITICAGFAASSSSATPLEIKSSTFVNDTDSLVLGDTIDSRTLWVLPPNSGSIGAINPSPLVSKPICRAIEQSLESVGQAQSELKTIKTQMINAVAAVDVDSPTAATKFAALKARFDALNDVLIGEQKEIDDFYQKYGTQDGGFAHIVYTAGWKANVSRLKILNPSLTVIPVETDDLSLYFSIPGSKNKQFDITGMPFFKAYTVQGEVKNGSMSDALGVDLSLSQLGGCYFAYPLLFGTDTSPIFSMSAVYKYPRAYSFSVNASYNIWQIYKYLHTSGTEGGLFTSSSWSKVIEDNWGDAAFHISWKSEDPNGTMTASEQLEATKIIKADLLSNLASLARTQIGAGLSEPAAPGPHGATVLADGLMQACGANGYCVGTAVALRALDAIFGSSGTSASYQKSLDVTASYSFNSSTARYAQYGTNFAASAK